MRIKKNSLLYYFRNIIILFVFITFFATFNFIFILEQTLIVKNYILPSIVAVVLGFLITKIAILNKMYITEKNKAQQANRFKSLFLANMSHEIRTPMNAVLGFSELLKRTKLNEKQIDYINTVLESGEILLNLINDILDISKIEAGELALEYIEFDLNYLVRSLVEIMRPKLQEKEIKLLFKYEDDLPLKYMGDPTRIRQILLNLLSNAVKFTNKAEIKINVYSNNKQESRDLLSVILSVKDTGIGIPSDKKEIIFQKFQQADSSTTRNFGGTGLGLSIIKALVNKMNGNIELISTSNEGSEFKIILPLQVLEVIDNDIIIPVKIEDLKGKKAIIINDNKEDQDIIIDICREIGIDIITVYNLHTSIINTINSLSDVCEIVFFNFNLSTLKNEDLFKHIIKIENLKTAKLIALVLEKNVGIAAKCEDLGFHAFLPKPFTKSELLGTLKALFGDMRSKKKLITRHIVEEIYFKDKRILVAEDNFSNQKYFEILLHIYCIS